MVLGIVGSYRKGGVIDQAVSAVLAAAQAGGAETAKIYLLDAHLEFCSNCRRCTQEPGPAPGQCPHQDDMPRLLQQLESAEALVLGAPVNCGNVNALTQRFLERLVCYSYWPWGQSAPRMRKGKGPSRPAVLITSSAMPSLMGRFLTGSLRGLKLGAQFLGARPVATIYIGLSAKRAHQELGVNAIRKAQRAGKKLSCGTA